MYRDSSPRMRALTAGELAWIAVPPCALATVAAIVLLGPPLGDTFLGPGSLHFWARADARPEPVEHARYLIALAGSVLLAAVALVGTGRRWQLRPRTIHLLVAVGQFLTVAFLALCLAAQNNVLLSADTRNWEHTKYFTRSTLVTAAALALLPFALLRWRALTRLAARLAHETRPRAVVWALLAVVLTVAWLLTMVNFDSSIGNTNPAVSAHVLWSMDETFAILNGRTPLVNFHAQYGQLWPYLAALAMHLAGTTIGVYTIVMASVSGLALLAVYATFRRVVRSSLLAFALYAPFLATGFFMKLGPLDDRYGPANLFSLWPVRYGGAYLLAWLTARHVARAAPRRRALLFLAGGLVVLNNPEFGVPALGATLVALLCTGPPRSWRAVARLLGNLAAGLATAMALVTLLTLAHSGELPHFRLLFEFSRLYGVGGWAMLPMPTIGLHLALFVTFSAALVLAVVRTARHDEDVLLTGMLAWIGVFGLGAGSYFVGRSHPEVLIDLFSPWTFALAMLLVAAARTLAARAWRRPSFAQIALLFGCGIAVCSLPQTPTPWSQLKRLRDDTPTPLFKQLEATRFVAHATARGERVAILIPLGHRIAYDAHVTNVAPYSSIEAMPTPRQLTTTIRRLRAEHVKKVFTSERFSFAEELALLAHEGFSTRATEGDTSEWTDAKRTPRR